MSTDDLIDRLGREAGPAPRRLAFRRLAIGVALGAVVTLALMWGWLGIRRDLVHAMGSGPFWMKVGYTLAIAVAMFWLLERLGRPGARTARQMLIAVAPPLILGVLAAVQLAGAEEAARHHLIMGHSSAVCPWRILILSMPILSGALWALGGLAPTRPALAGAVAGLCAGGAGAFIYAFHCRESAMPFVVIWYSFGILLCGVIGAAVGRFMLRW